MGGVGGGRRPEHIRGTWGFQKRSGWDFLRTGLANYASRRRVSVKKEKNEGKTCLEHLTAGTSRSGCLTPPGGCGAGGQTGGPRRHILTVPPAWVLFGGSEEAIRIIRWQKKKFKTIGLEPRWGSSL